MSRRWYVLGRLPSPDDGEHPDGRLGPATKNQPASRDDEELQARFIEAAKNGCVFIPDKGVTGPGNEVGRLIFRFSLFKLLHRLGLEERDEGRIIKLIDKLAAERRLVILGVRPDRSINFRDFFVSLEIGTAKRGFPNFMNIPTVYQKDFFLDKPMTKAVVIRGGNPFKSLNEKVAERREALHEYMKKRFGCADLRIESELHKQDLKDEARFRRAIAKIARAGKK